MQGFFRPVVGRFTKSPKIDSVLTLSIPRNFLSLNMFHCHLWKHFDTFSVYRDLCVPSAGCRRYMSNFENTRKFKDLPLPPKVCPHASPHAPRSNAPRPCLPLDTRPAQSSLVKPDDKAKNINFLIP